MSSKNKILDKIKMALEILGSQDDPDGEIQGAANVLSRAVGELRQLDAARQVEISTLQGEGEALRKELGAAVRTVHHDKIDEEAWQQRLTMKDGQIAELNKKVTLLEADLVRQQNAGYNVPMIRDFLEELRNELNARTFEWETGNAVRNKDIEDEIIKYMKRYGQLGPLVPITVERIQHSIKYVPSQQRAAEYQADLAHLEAIWHRFEFALEAATRRNEVFILHPDGDRWETMERFVKKYHHPQGPMDILKDGVSVN